MHSHEGAGLCAYLKGAGLCTNLREQCTALSLRGQGYAKFHHDYGCSFNIFTKF